MTNLTNLPIIVEQIANTAGLEWYDTMAAVSKCWRQIIKNILPNGQDQTTFETMAAADCKLYLKAPTTGWPLRMFVTAFRHLCQTRSMQGIHRFIAIAKKSDLSPVHFRDWHADVGLLQYDEYCKLRNELPNATDSIACNYVVYPKFEAACMHDDVAMAGYYYTNTSWSRLNSAFIFKYDAHNILKFHLNNDSVALDAESIVIYSNNLSILRSNRYFQRMCCSWYPIGPKCLNEIRDFLNNDQVINHNISRFHIAIRATVVYNALLHNQYDIYKEFCDTRTHQHINWTILKTYQQTSPIWLDIINLHDNQLQVYTLDASHWQIEELFFICDAVTLYNLLDIEHIHGKLICYIKSYDLCTYLFTNGFLSSTDRIQLFEKILDIVNLNNKDLSTAGDTPQTPKTLVSIDITGVSLSKWVFNAINVLTDPANRDTIKFDWSVAVRKWPNYREHMAKISHHPDSIACYRYDPKMADLFPANRITPASMSNLAQYACIHNRVDLFEHKYNQLKDVLCPICHDPCQNHLKNIRF